MNSEGRVSQMTSAVGSLSMTVVEMTQPTSAWGNVTVIIKIIIIVVVIIFELVIIYVFTIKQDDYFFGTVALIHQKETTAKQPAIVSVLTWGTNQQTTAHFDLWLWMIIVSVLT